MVIYRSLTEKIMNKLICLMGKSCTGKDTIYKKLLQDPELDIRVLKPCTTRPRRLNEKEGIEYNFVSEEEYESFKNSGMILEERSYDTACGIWRYFTLKDKELMESDDTYIYIGTLEAYDSLKNGLGEEKLIPVYIEVNDSIRIDRAVHREKKQAEPKFTEMCRRFIADTEDFSEDKLKAAGISPDSRFNNEVLEECLSDIKAYILKRI